MSKILIAEDDLMIADALEETLVRDGYEVCGIARTVAEGVALGQLHRPDLTIIDLQLADGGLETEIAAELTKSGRPGVLYATCSMARISLAGADGDACIAKFHRFADLPRGLEIVAGIVATGAATPPFPRAVHVLSGEPAIRPGPLHA